MVAEAVRHPGDEILEDRRRHVLRRTPPEPKIGVVIPVGAGRIENLHVILACLSAQTVTPDVVIVVGDGHDALDGMHTDLWGERVRAVRTDKHQPGMEQPRNIGVRALRSLRPDVTHVWFLDSDVMVEPECLETYLEALQGQDQDRILVGPYDWLPEGVRPAPGAVPLELHVMDNDPRWPSFHRYEADDVLTNDLAAGLACFSGNLVWPVDRFTRVGGFWAELHHGRCEDGELGLRAVAMGVPISFVEYARGWHLWHPINIELTLQRNARDVPMLNERHPWVQGGGVLLVDRDGKAFDVKCRKCESVVPTIAWWRHAEACGVAPEIPVET